MRVAGHGVRRVTLSNAMPMSLPAGAAGLAVALGAGLLIGLERERRKRSRGPAGARAAAGIRSFAMAALAGALARLLAEPWLVILGAAVVAVLVASAYRFGRLAAHGRPDDDPGVTTELALVVTYLIGVLAVSQPALAAAVAVVVAVLLAARERLHRFATTLLTEHELHDALLLAALALVLLPLMPGDALPWLGGLVPRTLLWLLLLILLLQAAGHLALRAFGARAGLAVAGFCSGFVSSTATIASLGVRARAAPEERGPRTAGAVASAVATWVQAALMLLAVAPAAAAAFAPAAAAGALATLAVAVLAWSRGGAQPAARQPRSRRRGPLRLREALVVATLLSLVTLAVGWVQRAFGASGLFAGVALAALADAHAAVGALAALHASGQLDPAMARDGTLLAIGVNSLVRSGVAMATGGVRFGAPVAGALTAAFAAAAVTVWLGG